MHDMLLQGQSRPLMNILPPMGCIEWFYALCHSIQRSPLGLPFVLSLTEPHHVPECSETHSEYDNPQNGTTTFSYTGVVD